MDSIGAESSGGAGAGAATLVIKKRKRDRAGKLVKKPPGGGDRLSKLKDRALGHVLSFLPAEEAARAALLSSRWRHVFAAVHTVSLEEPESPIPDGDDDDDRCYSPGWSPPPEPNAPPPFYSNVSAAIIARQGPRGAVSLRALRIALESYRGSGDSFTVDQWVSYAVRQAAAEGLELDLRLRCRSQLCKRSTRDDDCRDHMLSNDDDDSSTESSEEAPRTGLQDAAGSQSNYEDNDRPIISSDNDDDRPITSSDDDDGSPIVFSDDDERKEASGPWWRREPEYIMTRVIFSCAHLRSLSLGSCCLALPNAVNLPSLVTLLLSDVSDPGREVERLVASCPRLADLTLEACDAVTKLTIAGGSVRLRRLALRCCHNLTAVAVDSSELVSFEYRGAVPDSSFLTLHGGSTRVTYCKVDICGQEARSQEDLVNLRKLLQRFANAKRLHLESARLGAGFDKDVPTRLAFFSSLRHLEMRGCLPDDDEDGTRAIGAVTTLLEHAPNLETVSLAFRPQEHNFGARYVVFSEEELLDRHHLSYNPHSVLAAPSAAIPCLRGRVREINLAHYHGGSAQRALAKFLLSNTPAIDRLWCEFAEGPMWTQIQLMDEIGGWLINKSADIHFA